MSATVTTGTVKYTAGKAINTQYGERINAVIILADNQEIKIWGKPDDQSLRALKKNQSVELLNDGKSWKLLEKIASSNGNGHYNAAPPTARWTQEDINTFMGLVADYGAAYEFCLAKAAEMVEKGLLPRESLVQVATTMFIQAIRKIGK